MKNIFPGYYPPTDTEYNQIWNEALVVLDTNVLLDLYRLPIISRNAFFSVLKNLNARLWIPHHVGLEYQRNRLSVIAQARKSMTQALKSSNELTAKLKDIVNNLQLEKHGIDHNPEEIISDINNLHKKLNNAINAVHNEQLDISSSDSIRDRLDEILLNQVGEGPKSQPELDELAKNGEVRYNEKIPPGFADASKGSKQGDGSYFFAGMKYLKKHGDLILWRQLISHINQNQIKSVIFVTSDVKEDWWWISQGKTIGPHPDLVNEIKRETTIDLFWMYTSQEFLRHASKYLNAEISDQVLNEVDELSASKFFSEIDIPEYLETTSKYKHTTFDELNKKLISTSLLENRLLSYASESEIWKATAIESGSRWLKQYLPNLSSSKINGIDFVDDILGIPSGYKIVYSLDFFKRKSLPKQIIEAITFGNTLLESSEFYSFTILIVVPLTGDDDIYEGLLNTPATKLLSDYIKNCKNIEAILGVSNSGLFRTIWNSNTRS